MTRVSTCLVLTLALSLFMPMIADAQAKTSIAILPFTSSGLSEADLEYITLLLEGNLLKYETLQVIDQVKREKVLAYLDPSLLKCADVECALRAAKGLSADVVVLGTVAEQDHKLVVDAKSIDVKTGRTIRAGRVEAAAKADLPRAMRILSSTLLGMQASGESLAETPDTEQERQERLKALESSKASLSSAIAEIQRQKAQAQSWGWVSLGFGAAAAVLSGVSWYLSDIAYEKYTTTSDTDEAIYYRQQLVMWDTIMLASAGAGVLSIGISIPIFALSPDSGAESVELERVESEIASLKVPVGTEP